MQSPINELEYEMSTRDYAIKMRDSTGRELTLCINGDSIDELIALGHTEADAVEGVEGNTFANAIARGEIGADAWVVNELE